MYQLVIWAKDSSQIHALAKLQFKRAIVVDGGLNVRANVNDTSSRPLMTGHQAGSGERDKSILLAAKFDRCITRCACFLR